MLVIIRVEYLHAVSRLGIVSQHPLHRTSVGGTHAEKG